MPQQGKLFTHSLFEIPASDWNTLLDLYSGQRSKPTGYNVINNYIQWKKKEPVFDVKFLSLDGEWQSDGTFIIIANNGSMKKTVYFNTLSNNLERLANALLCLTYSSEEYQLHGYEERLAPAADVYIRQCDNSQRLLLKTSWYRASKEVVAKFSIEPPSGITLRELETKDAETVNEIWPYREKGSEEFVKCLIDHNISVGAYDNKGKLIAWCLRLPTGSLGLLQVKESHKRLGLGSLMVRYMSKKITKLDGEALASVVIKNTPSKNMFEKLGFHKTNIVYWYY
ncbi:uncharacterized protein LOC117781066 [Drosophila innubila]|uniref:uncharacterized protein LOC117781066 n=1 Tax=Drosophila innubila TaxID=198719 RepID=UPI00148BE5FC|nr:uncharacterized protein LOC117781066 [Drosophila innubila]